MKHMLWSAAFAAALLGSASPAFAVNVIVNGGFETGALGPWFQDRDFGGSQNWLVTTTTPHTGTYAAMDIGNKELRQNFAGVATSAITSATFWAKHPNLSTAPMFVDFFYSDSTDTGFTVNTSSVNWELFDVTSNLAAGKILTGFSVFGYVGGTGDPITFLDDVAILTDARVPEPATWALMILGFGAIGGAMRRQTSVRVKFAQLT